MIHFKPAAAFGGVGIVILSLVLSACGDSKRPTAVLGAIGSDNNTALPTANGAKTRYTFAGQCVALQSLANSRFVTLTNSGSSYAANGNDVSAAEPFFLKSSGLGRYLIFDHSSQLLSAAAPTKRLALSAADDTADWVLRGTGDSTVYPPPPPVDVDADPAVIAAYRNFKDPLRTSESFGFSTNTGARLSTASDGSLQTATVDSSATAFKLVALPAKNCAEFPEAQDNTAGPAFTGTTADGRVLGWADSHLHATSTSFLGGAKPGGPFHRFGVSYAVADCSPEHGPTGQRDCSPATPMATTRTAGPPLSTGPRAPRPRTRPPITSGSSGPGKAACG